MEDITSQGASHLAGTRRGFVSEVLRCNSSSSSGVMINMIQRWGMFHSLEGGGWRSGGGHLEGEGRR